MAVLEVTTRWRYAPLRRSWPTGLRKFHDLVAGREDFISVHVFTEAGSFCRDEWCIDCKRARASVLYYFFQALFPPPPPIIEQQYVYYSPVDMQTTIQVWERFNTLFVTIADRRTMEPGLPIAYFIFYAELEELPSSVTYDHDVPGRALSPLARSP